MNNMNLLTLTAVTLGLASTAFMGAGNDGDYGVLFWLFISFGALVVIAQLIPAILVIIGFSKGFPIKHKMPEVVKEKKGSF